MSTFFSITTGGLYEAGYLPIGTFVGDGPVIKAQKVIEAQRQRYAEEDRKLCELLFELNSWCTPSRESLL